MTAEFDEELISASLDGELTAAEQAAVERRLAESPVAAQQYEDFQKMGQWLRDLPREAAPADLLGAIREQMAQASPASTPAPVAVGQRAGRRRYPLTVYFASAATFLVLLSAIGYYQWGQPNLDSTAEFKTTNMAIAAHEAHEFPEYAGVEMQAPAAASVLRERLEETNALGVAKPAAPMAPDTAFGVQSLAKTDKQKLPLSVEIPAPPVMVQVAPEEALKRLNASPKISGQLEPGELVRYITAQDGQVAVVELSVVDVSRSFGEIQVLLTGNQIVATPEALLADNAEAPGGELGMAVPLPEVSRVAPQVGGQTLESQATSPSSQPALPGPLAESGLVALYVETSEAQFLQALNQMETLPSVKTVHLGEAPRVGTSVYAVEPMEQESAGQSLVAEQEKKRSQTGSREAPSGGLTFSLAQTETPLQGRSLWRGRMSPLPEEGTHSLLQQRSQHLRAMPPAKNPQEPKAEPPSAESASQALTEVQRSQMLKNTAKAAELSQQPSSYQVPLRLVPQNRLAIQEEETAVSAVPAQTEEKGAGTEAEAESPRVRVLLILSHDEARK